MRTLRLTLAAFLLSTTALAQQVVQRGPFGKPNAVFDDTGQWTAPALVKESKDVEIYIPDVTSPTWLKKNYRLFEDRGQYVITMFTRYRTPEACRANQINWGFSDQAHLDACATDITYRVRQATVDTNLKTITLIMAAMVDPDGNLYTDSIQRQSLTRRWPELDPNTQAALDATTALVSRQMALYDRRVQSTR